MHQLWLPRETRIWRWSMTQMDIPLYQIGQRSAVPLTLQYTERVCVAPTAGNRPSSSCGPFRGKSHPACGMVANSNLRGVTPNYVILSSQQIEYLGFARNFYTEHEEISKLPSAEVHALRAKMGLKVTGFQAPKPCVSFAHFNFDDSLMSLIRKSEYSQPTGIQSQVSG